MNCRDGPPFFIVGHPRSGTTLLRFMLSSHPRLTVPDETGFVPFLRVDPARALTVGETTAVVSRIARLNVEWDGMVEDIATFHAALRPPTLRSLLNALFCQKIGPHGAVRWGDKTPLYVQYLPRIRAIWPDAKVIHVVRDGRDAALSALHKWGGERGYMDMTYLLRNWVRNVQTGRTQGELLGSDYLELRYETLVREPNATLRRVCAFLGEAFVPAMLDFDKLAREVGGGVDGHVEVQRPLSVVSIGRWEREMGVFDRKLAECIAGPLLAELGYAPTDAAPLTTAERARAAALNARFLLTDTTRTILYRTGILTLNRNRRKRNTGTTEGSQRTRRNG